MQSGIIFAKQYLKTLLIKLVLECLTNEVVILIAQNICNKKISPKNDFFDLKHDFFAIK